MQTNTSTNDEILDEPDNLVSEPTKNSEGNNHWIFFFQLPTFLYRFSLQNDIIETGP